MFTRSGMYYFAHHRQNEQPVRLPPSSANQNDVHAAPGHEELGVFLRLWGVILTGVAVILCGSWLLR
ncbi:MULTISPECIES: hypothetical protein [unclassified Phyllobacterium]|uniref:hypothetical protein n=1 Tax=Phyllobacterium TaxID=28100 RepID=UPI0013AFA538|nr:MULTISPECIES: hypothetical protein [unclassified Phyllobacterium]MBA8900039.1 hypothetical protein [Phyllobacterium sp. P30BS-XVII]UGX86003.1 hypothetical protein LLE53_016450 [Phyllobacterium sp. T1293]